ncbi:MAG: Elongation factor 4 [Candidatus Moranbacteria bacterium GW2011_GWE2_35_2-]|nr:MAG: Elongation factor 4 [Candidatus Moranbacteria bacterium GW2011_GWE2_35_2-]KKQ22767.1 MAG: Elongation factor 4 [Candidatus Moranbacteria bacterium GW2011_GWF2_37_11]KKQ28921.1 MAG: Elongation factor 4 [Candidatus Moranbacteria bacterium GW2011_GWD1_37_17]KKQ31002.1 MAG: Elongation factor 4 [Candidatus Moranbacteria bacterium GW2011_GWE1_37_24]KKQ48063.1 MAG: Elongation factor 4 [Candidatus Moranbacteria bacterium GW2011_GWD2_37_9]HBO16800.1 elongation factor 4 [Candidatus Moranbacteria 
MENDYQKNIRNFCIIAHIDHGKSTLSDRFLEFTGAVEKRKMKEQLLDQMDLERERGITIKLQPVRMEYFSNDQKYILNLIDTPGHVDFGYEVSRSLAAVEGAILLVDATKGVQAQTLSNLYLAIEQGLEIIPVINKIDLPNAEVEKTKKEVVHILGCSDNDILLASGKTGIGVSEIIQRVIEKVPSPMGDIQKPLRALIFDSKYDIYKGVLAYARIVDGQVKREDKVLMMATEKETSVVEVGSFRPAFKNEDNLKAGDIGYIATGFKSVEYCRVGDTITKSQISNLKSQKLEKIEPLSGYKEVRPMVYASFYPVEGDEYTLMRDALEKLRLNDAAFVFEPESNLALGKGFRCGFLGMLHLEIIQARLEREFEISPTITTPSVVYRIKLKNQEEEKIIYSASDMPDVSMIEGISEPYAKLDIITPSNYLGSIMDLMSSIRAEYKNTEYIDQERVLLSYESPLTDIIVNFHDELKSVSSGFASMNYEVIGYRQSDLVKMDILVAEEKVEALSRIVPRERVLLQGKAAVAKLRDSIPRQNFVIAIQAAIGGKIIARETIRPFRKDVISKLYGGDVTRKRKLLEKQKKGKKKMKNVGRVVIPSEAFLSVLKK